jgi:hypothetical protein
MSRTEPASLRLDRFTAPVLGRVTEVHSPDVGEAPRQPLVTAAAWTVALVALGIGLRLAYYWPDRALWHDEAALACNLVERSLGGLLQPLDYNQGAPVGFLLVQKLVVVALGPGEHALRLVPVLCGVAALALFPWVARQYLPRRAALFAVALFALSPFLIRYGGEVKQYSGDVLVAVVLLGWAAIVGRLPDGGRSGVPLVWGVLGATALWFSHAAVFLLAGTGAAYGLRCLWRRDWSAALGLASAASVWLLSFAACYFLALQDLARSDLMLQFWQKAFAPLPPRSVQDLNWFWDAPATLLQRPGGLGDYGVGLGALLLVLGTVTLYRSDRYRLAALCLPVGFVLLASALHKYPFSDRLVLFLVPGALLVIAAGAGAVWSRARRPFPLLTAALLGLLFAAPTVDCAALLLGKSWVEDVRPSLAHLAAAQADGDLIYVPSYARPTYAYYGPRYGLPTGTSVVPELTDFRSGTDARLQDLDRMRGQQRVWVLLTRDTTLERLTLAHLNAVGTRLGGRPAPDGGVFLYDLSAPSAPSAAAR